MVLAKVFFFCARRKERLCYRCFNIFSRKRLPVVWQEKGPQGEIRKHERGLVSGGRPLVTAFHWNFSCTLMTFFILGFHLWRYKPEKEERVINRSLFCWDTLSTFLFSCLLVCFLPSLLSLFLWLSFFSSLKQSRHHLLQPKLLHLWQPLDRTFMLVRKNILPEVELFRAIVTEAFQRFPSGKIFQPAHGGIGFCARNLYNRDRNLRIRTLQPLLRRTSKFKSLVHLIEQTKISHWTEGRIRLELLRTGHYFLTNVSIQNPAIYQ